MIKVIIYCLSQKQTACGQGSKFITARRTSHARPRSHARATNVTGPFLWRQIMASFAAAVGLA